MKRKQTTDEVNREYCETLKALIEREDKTLICLDCKIWGDSEELIVLCQLHAAVPELLEALKGVMWRHCGRDAVITPGKVCACHYCDEARAAIAKTEGSV